MPDSVTIQLKAVDAGQDAALQRSQQNAEKIAAAQQASAERAAKAQASLAKQAADEAINQANRAGRALDDLEVKRLQMAGKANEAVVALVRQHYDDRIDAAQTSFEKTKLVELKSLALTQTHNSIKKAAEDKALQHTQADADKRKSAAERLGKTLNEIEVQRLKLSGRNREAELLQIKQGYDDRIEAAQSAEERTKLIESRDLALREAGEKGGILDKLGLASRIAAPLAAMAALGAMIGKVQSMERANTDYHLNRDALAGMRGPYATGARFREMELVQQRNSMFLPFRWNNTDYAGAAQGADWTTTENLRRQIVATQLASFQTASLASTAPAAAAASVIGMTNAAETSRVTEEAGIKERQAARKAAYEAAQAAETQRRADEDKSLSGSYADRVKTEMAKRPLPLSERLGFGHHQRDMLEGRVDRQDAAARKTYDEQSAARLKIIQDENDRINKIEQEAADKRVALAKKSQELTIAFSAQNLTAGLSSGIMSATQRGAGMAAALQAQTALAQASQQHAAGLMTDAQYAASQTQGKLSLTQAARQAWADRYAYTAQIEDVGGMGQRMMAAAASNQALAPDAKTEAERTQQGLDILAKELPGQTTYLEKLDIPLSQMADTIAQSIVQRMGAGH